MYMYKLHDKYKKTIKVYFSKKSIFNKQYIILTIFVNYECYS